MSALASLVRAYDRMAVHGKVPAYGYSRERIGFLIPLHSDGTVAHEPIDLRQGEGKKKTAPLMAVPASFKRPGVTPRPFFLWDNSAFALGVTASEGKDGQTRWQAFHDRHLRDLSGNQDEGLQALLNFIGSWAPEHFSEFSWPEDMKDQNIVFALESERLANIMIHDRPAARELWARLIAADEKSSAVCLITGDHAPMARLHPAIKGVWGAQTAGASIVSFNLDAFTSYGHEQGENAPVSEAAAFAYTSALNHFLERDSGHRIQIGDASTVFWADSSDARAALEAESLFFGFFDEKEAEAVEEKKIESILAKLRAGRPIEEFKPDLQPGVRFFVLALAPNAARLSVRFYIEDNFGEIAERYKRHLDRLRIDPPSDEAPSMWQMLLETAVLRKSDNIQPNLAGEWMRAILTDTPYPLTLLSTLIMRLRADHKVNALRVSIIKSVLIQNFKMEVPVSLDRANMNPAYLLGRLFATLEQIQDVALGDVKAGVRERFYGAASANPRNIFPLLLRMNTHHLSKAEKGDKRRLAGFLANQMSEIISELPCEFPATLVLAEQGKFALGYFHQRHRPKDKAANPETPE
jgi:CRISPR-associated protein Csd1